MLLNHFKRILELFGKNPGLAVVITSFIVFVVLVYSALAFKATSFPIFVSFVVLCLAIVVGVILIALLVFQHWKRE